MNWAEMTTDGAPWWFMILAAGVLAIVSTLVGGLIAALTALAVEKYRGKYEVEKSALAFREVWLDKIRSATAAFFAETRRYVKESQRIHSKVETDDGKIAWRRDVSATSPDIQPSFERYWELVLIADEETSDLAHKLMRQIRRYEMSVPDLQYEDVTNREWTSRRAAVVSARGALADHIIALSRSDHKGIHVETKPDNEL